MARNQMKLTAVFTAKDRLTHHHPMWDEMIDAMVEIADRHDMEWNISAGPANEEGEWTGEPC